MVADPDHSHLVRVFGDDSAYDAFEALCSNGVSSVPIYDEDQGECTQFQRWALLGAGCRGVGIQRVCPCSLSLFLSLFPLAVVMLARARARLWGNPSPTFPPALVSLSLMDLCSNRLAPCTDTGIVDMFDIVTLAERHIEREELTADGGEHLTTIRGHDKFRKPVRKVASTPPLPLAFVGACLSAFLPACLPAYLPACLPTCLRVNLCLCCVCSV